jgi:hypothetical protein
MMKYKYAAIILFLFTLTSCAVQKPTTNAKDYWTKPPDLSNVTYEGGDGKTIESPIVVKAKNERDGIASEYAFIAKAHGEKFKDWKPIGQATTTKDGRKIDSIKIQLIDKNETLTYYFDITDFYGKF